MKQGKFQEAKTLLQDALNIYEKKYGVDHPFSASTLNNLAQAEKQLNNMEPAEKYYKRVLKIDKRLHGTNHPNYATTLINLAILYSSLGRVEDAKAHYKEGLAIREKVLGINHPSYLNTLENLGLQEMASGSLTEAEKYFRQTVEILINQVKTVFPALLIEDQENFSNSLREAVQRYNFVASELLDTDPELVKNIFDHHIKTKSILLSPQKKIRQAILEGNDQDLKNVYHKWQKEKLLLANCYRLGTRRLLENNITVEELENSVEEIEQVLTAHVEGFSSIIPDISTNWSMVQNEVKEGESIVQIIKIREFKSQKNEKGVYFGFSKLARYLAIIFSEEEDPSGYVFLDDKFKTEEKLYYPYTRLLQNKDAANSSFESLWKPIHNEISETKLLKIIPDGIYHKINPNIFQVEEGRFIIDEYFVSHLTSCKDIFKKRSEGKARQSIFFGNPDFKLSADNNTLGITSLPNAEVEINAIAAILEPKAWDVETYALKEASELKLRSARNPTVLHLATHGFFADNDDFISSINSFSDMQYRSGLYLSGASRAFSSYMNGESGSTLNDGVLTTEEIMGLNLDKTKLVVLSSCDTNLDDINNNDSVFGLRRAFMVAGADNIITSLSKTREDVQSELMLLFYHKFIETENISESLRFAQIKLRAQHDKPKIWGSFILIGNG